MTRPRMLVVEDDPSIRRFVTLALEDEPLELLSAASVPEALAQLRSTGPVQLLMTDLMMPGPSGTDLLDALRAAPALRGEARVVVLSAGLDPDTRTRLQALDVWRMLHKPVGVLQLQECVREALALAGGPAHADDAAAGTVDALLSPDERRAVAQHFGGDLALFVAFRASCHQQFSEDLLAGRDAVRRQDAAALRRLAHSLKSVLSSLAQPQAAGTARRLEDACANARWPDALREWRALEAALAPAPEAPPGS